ncbi:helix-turn-helix domain-containing protein [uncultured Allofournierella sp.]|uniref:helix-turn-helix domain-containing protein n=1 Tax=uncultured Allofournierella sp. TaxID=1940258 RepID=UPI0025F1A89A|nr:helix-turn-helix domain-containing protein [uncultured Fournierella sp.]
MDAYVTGATIRKLREAKKLTQAQLAEKLDVSDKAVSKWETGKGLPDITLIEPLAAALGVSLMELLSGDKISNNNRAANMLRTVFYVCPVCGNVIPAAGQAAISCCGISLPQLEPEEMNGEHMVRIEAVEDERFVTLDHSMSKTHFISFIAWVSGDRVELVKLYPEGNAQCRLHMRGHGYLYLYCNRHGLMRKRL